MPDDPHLRVRKEEPVARGWSSTVSRRGAAIDVLVLLVLGAALFAQGSVSARRNSLTFDEHLYIPAGHTHWTWRDFRLSREHPPLSKLVGALPLLGLDLSTERSRAIFDSAPQWRKSGLGFRFGEVFLFEDNAALFDKITFRARLAAGSFAFLLVVGVFLWARPMAGRAGAVVAAAAAAFNPDVVAHGFLVATDLPMAALYLTTVAAFWTWVHRPSVGTIGLLGCSLGLAVSVKYSSLLLLPVLGVLALAAWWRPPAGQGSEGPTVLRPFAPGPPVRRLTRSSSAAALILALAALIVCAVYLFVEPPSSFVRGMQQIYVGGSAEYPTFLLGEYRDGGFWHYYLVALALKLPVPVLALAALGCWLTARRAKRVDWLTLSCIVVPPVALLVAMTLVTVQLAHRYVLGVHGFVFIACALAIKHALASRRWGLVVVVGALVIGIMLSGLRALPFPLSYGNAFAGSPADFLQKLDDANNDWQHGWREVARLQREGLLGPVAIAGPPGELARLRPYGIRHVVYEPTETQPPPGTYLVAATRFNRIRHLLREQGRDVPLITRHEPTSVIAGCIYALEVAAPWAGRGEAELSWRARARPDGTRETTAVLTRRGDSDVSHGPYSVVNDAGVTIEEGTRWHGRRHGRAWQRDQAGTLVHVSDYWLGRLISESSE